MADKLKSSFGDNCVVMLPFWASVVWCFICLGNDFFLNKKYFDILVASWSEPGPGSARNGFLAKNYVG